MDVIGRLEEDLRIVQQLGVARVAVRLEETLRALREARDVLPAEAHLCTCGDTPSWGCDGCAEDFVDRCRFEALLRELLLGVAPPQAHSCERELQALPGYSPGRGTPESFACSCGKVYACQSEESEGVWWQLIGTELP